MDRIHKDGVYKPTRQKHKMGILQLFFTWIASECRRHFENHEDEVQTQLFHWKTRNNIFSADRKLVYYLRVRPVSWFSFLIGSKIPIWAHKLIQQCCSRQHLERLRRSSEQELPVMHCSPKDESQLIKGAPNCSSYSNQGHYLLPFQKSLELTTKRKQRE